jgi:glycosyltransferase involved in cell wall biosynthesis
MLQVKSSVETKTYLDKTVVSKHVCMHILGNFRGDVRARRAAEALSQAGLQVTIVDIGSESSHAIELQDGMVLKHMPVHRSFTTSRFKRRVLLRALWLFLRSSLYLLHTRADCYHALDLPALPACYIAACLHRKPLIFESYELPLSTLSKAEIDMGRRLLQALLAPVLRHIIPLCAGVIAVSPLIAREMSRRYPGANIIVVRNIPPYQAVIKSDLLRQHLRLGPQTHIALYQGHLQPDRGLDRLVRAARYLEPGIMVVIMGKGTPELQEQLCKLIASEEVANRVRILPPVPYEELLNWTASADIGLLLNPPDYALNVRLCLPNKLFEFLMAGLPLLTSQLDAVTDILEAHKIGQVISTLTPEGIGAAINAMLADRQVLEQMRRNALQAAQDQFYWEKEQQQLLRLYGVVLAK